MGNKGMQRKKEEDNVKKKHKRDVDSSGYFDPVIASFYMQYKERTGELHDEEGETSSSIMG